MTLQSWQELQKQYFAAFTSGQPGTGIGQSSSTSPWHDLLQPWWQSMLFHGVAKQFSDLLENVAVAGEDEDIWQQALHDSIKSIKVGFDEMFNHSNNIQPDWFSSFTDWSKSNVDLPDISRVFSQTNAEKDFQALFECYLDFAGAALSDTEKEKILAGLPIWENWREKTQAYGSSFNQLYQLALNKLEKKIIRLGKENQQITSLRQLYDLWIECNEQVYNNHISTREYSVLYAEFISAVMALRCYLQDMTGTDFGKMNLSSIANTKQTEEQKLRSELNDMKKEQQQSQAKLQAMLEQIHLLQSELEKINNQTTQNDTGDKSVKN